MSIKEHSAVFIDYVLKNKEGHVLDASKEDAPLGYIHGIGNLIPGLEKELVGCNVGDEVSVEVQPKDAYGEYNDDLLRVVPKSDFAEVEPLEPGVQFEVEVGKGDRQRTFMAHIISVNDQDVTFDMNHPLAGQVLCFDVKIQCVRVATPEELAQGVVQKDNDCSCC